MSNARELIDRIVPGATVAPVEPRKIKLSLLRDLRRLGMSDVDQHLGEIVSAIPAGRVTTYGALADAVGTSARYVGRFLGRRGHNLPWWRVVNAAGNPVPAARTEALQRLIDDGVALSSDGRVDLEAASWDPGQPHKRHTK